MLVTLSIRDVVLIDRLELAFQSGLATLTGETGAGKSILLDALGLALGARADSRLIRHGADQALVTATFEPPADHPVHVLIADHGLPTTDEGLVLRRTVASDGRSRAFVNDQAVSAGLLRQLGQALVEIHGQFDTHRLMDPVNHRALLDAYGGLTPLLAQTRELRRAWRQASDARSEAEAAFTQAQRDEDYLRHAAAELEEAAPEPEEEEALAARRTQLQSGEKLVEAITEAIQSLGGADATGGSGFGRPRRGGDGMEAALRGAMRALERVAPIADGSLDAALGALDSAATEVANVESLLDRTLRDLDLDPHGLEQVEERLFRLRALARKHDCAVDDLVTLQAELSARLAAIDHGGANLSLLTAAEAEAKDLYRRAADALSQARREAAGRLDTAVLTELGPLRLGKAAFRTRVEAFADSERDWGEGGWDRVAFEVATNPGTPPGPLDRIASGGELSRFMLALKVVLVRADPVPTLIFDEVDSGIGGAVAAAVGERLARLAQDVQVLVVTHSPQVAARGGVHWRISKSVGVAGARTSVDILDTATRREEIARMLAGATITDEARAAAESLLRCEPVEGHG